ncbi:glycosyltransferase family 2 protein [Ideonella sp. B7]|uniref:glycosyltransferase family 2 protein n=1 Tax=Ideonella benzenivorans TaxID=2831643 RepID=UPI001CED834F|nr:glycosyltransferase family 2 protein [Ideonella benzenivorans]MCA6215269.1 glycosyltransferase family 2 protein [Ideonella benzenivorans]
MFGRAKKASSSVRGRVESVEGRSLRGWACAVGPSETLELLVDGQAVIAGVTRLDRADVQAALHSERLALGFRIVLPSGLEERLADGGRCRLAVRVNGQLLPADVDLTLDAARWAALAVPAPTVGAVQGRLEALEGLLLKGWVVTADPRARIELLLAGELVDAASVRVEREDVRQTVPGAPALPGFELELPSHLWQQLPEGREAQLSVRVQDQVLPSDVVLRVGRHQVLEELQALATSADTADDTRPVRQYRLLAALEHAAAAGLMTHLPPALAAFVRRETARFGLPAPQDAGPGAELARPRAEHDIAQLTVWRAQRDFNARWRPGAEAAAVLRETLKAQALGEDTAQRFLQTLIPFFCAQHQYAALRVHLDIPALKMQAKGGQAWAISLLLAECVAAADFQQAAKVTQRLLDAPGWLNTECVAQAARDFLRHGERHPVRDEAAMALGRALVALLDRVARDPWGRAHDLHLIDAQVSLLLMAPAWPAKLTEELLDKAQRHYALVPAFWDCLLRRWPAGVALPGRLAAAQRAMTQLQVLLRPGASGRLAESDLELALQQLRGGLNRGHADAWQAAREIILALRMTPGTPPGLPRWVAELEGLAPSDVLRLAAHPLTDVQTDLPSDLLRQAVRGVTGVPLGPLAEQTCAVWRTLAAARSDQAHAALPTLSECRRLNVRETQFLGVHLATLRLVLMAERDSTGAGQVPDAELAELRSLWMSAWQQRAVDEVPCAPLWNAWLLVQRLLRRWPAQSGWSDLVADWSACLTPEAQAPVHLPDEEQLRLSSPGWGQDTLVVVYSCRANLASRVQAIRDSWGRSLTVQGVPWVVLVGEGDGVAPTGLAGDLLALPVSDAYEHLPDKTLALMAWVVRHTDFAYLYKIDDDCHLDVGTFQARSLHRCHHYMGRPLRRGEGDTDRRWHQARSASARGAGALDKSPEPSVYADGGSGYFVSRPAMQWLGRRSATTQGARLRLASFMEDKLIGDLLAGCGVPLSAEGYETLVRRRFGPGAAPVNAYQNTFFPGQSSPTWVTHLDESSSMASVEAARVQTALRPPRLWPTVAQPVLGGVAGTNQLELLSTPEGVAALADAPVIVVAVARNEKILMPHFLTHYRALGVRHFVLVDNLSDDGTREYLRAQPDVVLYSADTEYRHSHYGVAWQQAVLGAHALGRWVVLADIDEMLVYEDCEHRPITEWLAELDAQGHDAALTLMVDMYPEGDLSAADFTAGGSPFEIAPYFDAQPLVHWQLGAGHYSNGPTYLSALRHRLIPGSAPNLYTSQKVAVFRHAPWVRLSQGLHYASNLKVAPQPVAFAHFKYHAGFQQKVLQEIARKQHFNGAEEYRKYLALVAEARQSLQDPQQSRRWTGSRQLMTHLWDTHRDD